MVEIVPDFEMTSMKFFVIAKEQDCSQITYPEAEPSRFALPTIPGISIVDKRPPIGANARACCRDTWFDRLVGAVRRAAMFDENTNPNSSRASESSRYRGS